VKSRFDVFSPLAFALQRHFAIAFLPAFGFGSLASPRRQFGFFFPIFLAFVPLPGSFLSGLSPWQECLYGFQGQKNAMKKAMDRLQSMAFFVCFSIKKR
jgi:hypothetical protein